MLPDLKLSANWKLDAFELQGSPIGDLSGQLDWEGDELRLTGRSQGAGGALTVKAEAKTRGDWPVDLSGDFSGFGFIDRSQLLHSRQSHIYGNRQLVGDRQAPRQHPPPA